jgi:hypothetical protein
MQNGTDFKIGPYGYRGIAKISRFWSPGKAIMACRSCGSENQTEFSSEINIHFPGLKNVNKPADLVCPKLAVCLDCGLTEFAIAEKELRLLQEGGA